MILDRLFICRISVHYKSNTHFARQYEIKALNSEVARQLCMYKFISDNSIKYDSYSISVEPKKLTSEEQELMFHLYNTSFREIYDIINNKCSLLDFIKIYENFNGFNYIFDGLIHSFEIDFQGFCFRVLYHPDNICIDTSVVTYRGNNGRRFIIENDWQNFYVG